MFSKLDWLVIVLLSYLLGVMHMAGSVKSSENGFKSEKGSVYQKEVMDIKYVLTWGFLGPPDQTGDISVRLYGDNIKVCRFDFDIVDTFFDSEGNMASFTADKYPDISQDKYSCVYKTSEEELKKMLEIIYKYIEYSKDKWGKAKKRNGS
jgi:hypothetical protein